VDPVLCATPESAYLCRLKATHPPRKNHTTGELHSRNLHRAPYDFPRLVAASPELEAFLTPHPLGGDTIPFAHPEAVIALNRALLKCHYGIAAWDLPPGYLCPPVPSRADYLHHVADLVAVDTGGAPPRGPDVRVLDIGTGANAIYPLIGTHLYGWTFVGTDVDPVAVEWARTLVTRNPALAGKVEFRRQLSPSAIFANVVRSEERFALSICNPPFHPSAEAAAAGTRRKVKNLHGARPQKPVLNFGGRNNELWCMGGEVGFVQRTIAESAARPDLCRWFTTLVSKESSLPAIQRALAKANVLETRRIPMFAGQKQSRIVAWTFLSLAERRLATAK